MRDTSTPLPPEDYAEPRCPLGGDRYGAAAQAIPVPQRRIAEKLDVYMSRRDYAGAERHLLYWLDEAARGGDLRGELFLRNELIGHYRKSGQREPALRCAERALALLDELGFTDGVGAGTTLINAATAYSAFGDHERALALFKRARAIYEADGAVAPERLGGLYNNMAAACAALGRFGEALLLYERALAQMARVPHGAPERAITCLNMADAIEAELGAEAAEPRVAELLERAYALLREETTPRDEHYAFICEKCAPGFAAHGRFAAAAVLEAAARAIYERA